MLDFIFLGGLSSFRTIVKSMKRDTRINNETRLFVFYSVGTWHKRVYAIPQAWTAQSFESGKTTLQNLVLDVTYRQGYR